MSELVPSFKVNFTETEIEEVAQATKEIMRSGNLALGPHTDEFEHAMAEASQTSYAVAVNSGSTALEILYKAVGSKGRTILMPSNTNFATAVAAKNADARIELYDGGLYPNLNDIAERISSDTSAVVVVHIGGYLSPEIKEIAALCAENGIPLIEDAAHAHGAKLNDKAAGSFGEAAAFSFFLTKTVTTMEGGAITTDDSTLAEISCQYRVQGRGKDGLTHEILGNSWRMTEIGAAMGKVLLRNLDLDTEYRANIIDRYQAELEGEGLIFPDVESGNRPSGHKAIAILPEGISRASIVSAMRMRGVQMARGVYEKPLHQQALFTEYLAKPSDYPEATEFAENHVALPLWRNMPHEAADKVIAEMRETLRSV